MLGRRLKPKTSSQSLMPGASHRAPCDDSKAATRSASAKVIVETQPSSIPAPASTAEIAARLTRIVNNVPVFHSYLAHAIEDRVAEKIAACWGMYGSAVKDIITTVHSLPPNVRANPLFKAGLSGVEYTCNALQDHITNLPTDLQDSHVMDCMLLQSMMTTTLWDFLLDLHGDPAERRHKARCDIWDPEFSSWLDDDGEAVRRHDKMVDGDAEVPSLSLASVNLRTSIAEAAKAAPAHDPRWDVDLPFFCEQESDFTTRLGRSVDPEVVLLHDSKGKKLKKPKDVAQQEAEKAEVMQDDFEVPMKGASLPALVHTMTSSRSFTLELKAAFLLTFRFSFSALEVVQALVARYAQVAPTTLTPRQHGAWRFRATAVKMHIVHILQTWFTDYWYPGDHPALQLLWTFITTTINASHPRSAKGLACALQKALKLPTGPRRVFTGKDTTPCAPPTADLLKLESFFRYRADIMMFTYDRSCLELSMQLTLITWDMFASIIPEQLMQHFTHKTCRPTDCAIQKQLDTHAKFHNGISMWVTRSILEQPIADARGEVMKLFLTMACFCLSVGNYDGLVAIKNGLFHPAITRLDDSNLPLKKSAWHEALAYLEHICAPSGPYRKIRRHFSDRKKMHADNAPIVNAPTVPLMAVPLHALPAIFGLPYGLQTPSKLSPNNMLPNFGLWKMAADIILELEACHVPYPYTPAPHIQKFLKDSISNSMRRGHDEESEDLLALSVQLQPSPKASKPVKPSLLSSLPISSKKVPGSSAPKLPILPSLPSIRSLPGYKEAI
ncbi:ras GEF [Auriscalpium vulgare]|uniref:Ras GEF n=1 Tax=Auriscalpium vulgare TaxID=40419 RepID=A0ACB8S9B4_9AGAM|nr:ras GEF [Auriscalpium vulgare]